MRISEMNNCIEEMRKCYNFKDDETEIRLGSQTRTSASEVCIATKDKNGTVIEMSRTADRLEKSDPCL